MGKKKKYKATVAEYEKWLTEEELKVLDCENIIKKKDIRIKALVTGMGIIHSRFIKAREDKNYFVKARINQLQDIKELEEEIERLKREMQGYKNLLDMT